MKKFRTFIFDCDGVILNSNKVKSIAFYNAALPYGESAAQALVDFHVANGGISRYQKFSFFLDTIIGQREPGPSLDDLLSSYAAEVRKGLLYCEVTSGLYTFREKTKNSQWMVISGSDQAELRDIFFQRRLTNLFDGGIFGSPDTKVEIFARELSNGNITTPAVFFGDSKYDFESSTNAGLDFVFLTQWTEVVDYNMFIIDNQITSFYNLTEFIELENVR